MQDDKDTPVKPVAPVDDSAQAEQVATTEEVATPPQVAEEKEEKLYAGKFKSTDDLEKSYTESQSKLTQLAQENATLRQISQQVPEEAIAPEIPQLDPDSAAAVKAMLRQELQLELEARKSVEFAQEHADKLKDPLLSARTRAIIAESNAVNQYIDPKVALIQAEKELDARIKPIVKEAQAEGMKEGEELTRNKGQLGAVGESGKQPDVDPDKLSAKEYAKYHGLSYSE